MLLYYCTILLCYYTTTTIGTITSSMRLHLDRRQHVQTSACIAVYEYYGTAVRDSKGTVLRTAEYHLIPFRVTCNPKFPGTYPWYIHIIHPKTEESSIAHCTLHFAHYIAHCTLHCTHYVQHRSAGRRAGAGVGHNCGFLTKVESN